MFKKIRQYAANAFNSAKRSLSFTFTNADPIIPYGRTASNIAVNEYVLKQNVALLSGITLITNMMASIGAKVKKQENGGYVDDPDHVLSDILLYKFNSANTTPFNALKYLYYCAIVHGNGYLFIQRDNYDWNRLSTNTGPVVGLWNIRGGLGRTYLHTEGKKIHIIGGAAFPDEHILHLHGIFTDSIIGEGLLHNNREPIAYSKVVNEFGSNFFANGAIPGGIIIKPAEMEQETAEKVLEDFESKAKGVMRVGKTIMLEEGMQYVPNQINPEDMQMTETRNFQIREAARMLRIPPHMLYDVMSNNSYATLEQQYLEFSSYTLAPWAINFKQEASIKLLSPNERKVWCVDCPVEDYKILDSTTKLRNYSHGRNLGLYTLNDLLESEGKPKVDEEFANYRLTPSTMKTLQNASQKVDFNSISNIINLLDNNPRISKDEKSKLISVLLPDIDQDIIQIISKMIRE